MSMVSNFEIEKKIYNKYDSIKLNDLTWDYNSMS